MFIILGAIFFSQSDFPSGAVINSYSMEEMIKPKISSEEEVSVSKIFPNGKNCKIAEKKINCNVCKYVSCTDGVIDWDSFVFECTENKCIDGKINPHDPSKW